MKFFAAVLALLATGVMANDLGLGDLPKCSVPCAISNLATAGCESYKDVKCLCKYVVCFFLG